MESGWSGTVHSGPRPQGRSTAPPVGAASGPRQWAPPVGPEPRATSAARPECARRAAQAAGAAALEARGGELWHCQETVTAGLARLNRFRRECDLEELGAGRRGDRHGQ